MSVNFFNNKPSFPAKGDQGAKMTVQGGAFGGSGRKNQYYASPQDEEEELTDEEKYDSSSHTSPLNAKKFFNPDEAEEVFGDVYDQGNPLPPLSSDWENS